MKLSILDPVFSILKLPAGSKLPTWAMTSSIFSITRTEEELSIVCPSGCLPAGELFPEAEHDWKCLKVEGILDFSLTRILASLARPLAEHDISIFAISTYNTDYLLIKSPSMDLARGVLEKEGHTFAPGR